MQTFHPALPCAPMSDATDRSHTIAGALRSLALLIAFAAPALSFAQLPPDAVDLGLLKIPESIRSAAFDPVTLEPADPALPTWEHEGVTYGSSAPDSKEKFLADPAAYVEKAREERWVKNFIPAMSRIWCPVTDEVNPGGLRTWEVDGVTWESCCAFCDDSATEGDFLDAHDRLVDRARKSFVLTQGKYVEGASSPIDGAIKTDAAPKGDKAKGDAKPVAAPKPAWLEGAKLEPTWEGGARLIVENRCADCHRPGGLAPMSFSTWQETKKWSKGFKESIVSRSMPPWPASPESGPFANSRALTDEEMDVLKAWADAGFPKGTGGAPPTVRMDEWTIATPDHVFTLPAHEIPADAVEEAPEFALATGFDADRWIVAGQVIPGNEFSTIRLEAGPLGALYPGDSTFSLPAGYGFRVPAGATVPVQALYRKEKGFAIKDPGGRVGVVFGEGDLKEVVLERAAATDFVIPAGADAHAVKATFDVASDSKIVSVRPMLDRRGKSVVYTLKTPDGASRELLRIDRWIPEYRYRYEFTEPVAAPKGSKVEIEATYDNSKLNVKNPDAGAEVKPGVGGEWLEGWIALAR